MVYMFRSLEDALAPDFGGGKFTGAESWRWSM